MDQVKARKALENSLIQPRILKDNDAIVRLLDLLTCLPLAIVQAAAFINANEISISLYTSLYENGEDEVIELLSKDFEDQGRYRDTKNPIATTWLISFNQIRLRDPLAADYLSFTHSKIFFASLCEEQKRYDEMVTYMTEVAKVLYPPSLWALNTSDLLSSLARN
jgi:hypothetical protein